MKSHSFLITYHLRCVDILELCDLLLRLLARLVDESMGEISSSGASPLLRGSRTQEFLGFQRRFGEPSAFQAHRTET